MCTNFALIKKDGTTQLADRLKVDPEQFIYGSDIGPGAKISIVVERDGIRQVKTAIWWLYLQQTEQGLRPHRDYFSVNSNYAKLPKRPEYKTHRCIVPATLIVESQDGKNPHLLEPADGSAFALGGLWKEWVDKTSGEVVNSASVITLPGHAALQNIHRKSMPLWLPESDYNRWLDQQQTDTAVFADLLEPALRTDLKATPIDKSRTKQAIGESFLISA